MNWWAMSVLAFIVVLVWGVLGVLYLWELLGKQVLRIDLTTLEVEPQNGYMSPFKSKMEPTLQEKREWVTKRYVNELQSVGPDEFPTAYFRSVAEYRLRNTSNELIERAYILMLRNPTQSTSWALDIAKVNTLWERGRAENEARRNAEEQVAIATAKVQHPSNGRTQSMQDMADDLGDDE